MVFSAISRVFHLKWTMMQIFSQCWVRKKMYSLLHHNDTVRSRMKVEWGEMTQQS